MKSYFDSDRKFDYDEDIYKTAVKSLTIPSYIKADFEKILIKIIKYLSGDHAFTTYNKNHCCMYINYKLNKELKPLFYKINDTTFKIFQNFVQIHDNEKKTDTCTSKLHYPGYPTFYRLEHLYDLYDKLQYISILKFDDLFCSNLTDIVHKYNYDIDGFYDNDKNLFNKLLNFKELVEKLEFLPKSTCQEKIKQLKTPAKYLSDQKEELRKKQIEEESQRLSLQGPSASSPAIESEPLVAGNLESVESEISEGQQFIAPREQAQDLTVLKHEIPLGDKQETGDFRSAENTHSLETHQSLALSEKPSYQRGYVRDAYILGNPTNDEEGIMKSLQSTFSNIVQNVDPAPVLGVSGGMGVLFILFKYTPVGSFFGGRRRRFHQIPSSFRGFPPGDFANFQEYDGGFIGYSPMNISPLAE
ncbi:Plasmodium vivax Vir protein, putative [Plasmodium vivax]|uniref:Vir protein, putative n=1 Tax=Plasmodium vivax TaxID=5855 RepID=A0A1G4EIX3_PLAVI|nr:Plasmodium vivax Vir protein, putative [Plasmodium vivax]